MREVTMISGMEGKGFHCYSEYVKHMLEKKYSDFCDLMHSWTDCPLSFPQTHIPVTEVLEFHASATGSNFGITFGYE